MKSEFSNYKASLKLEEILKEQPKAKRIRGFLMRYFTKSKQVAESNLSVDMKEYVMLKLFQETKLNIWNSSLPQIVKEHGYNVLKSDHNNYLRSIGKRDKNGLKRDASGLYDVTMGRWLKNETKS